MVDFWKDAQNEGPQPGDTTGTRNAPPMPGAGTGPNETNGRDPERKRYDDTDMWYADSVPQLHQETKDGITYIWYTQTRRYEDGLTLSFTTNKADIRTAATTMDWQYDERSRKAPSASPTYDKATNDAYNKKAREEGDRAKLEQADADKAAKLKREEIAAANKEARTPPVRIQSSRGEEEWFPGSGMPGDMDYQPPGYRVRIPASETAKGNPETQRINGELYEYDPNAPGDNKWVKKIAAEMSPYEKKQVELSQARDEIRNQLEAGQLSLDQSKLKYEVEFKRIQNELLAEQNRLTQRGQDVTQRGQDIDAAVQLGREASQAKMASLAYLAPKGSTAQLARLQNAGLASSGSTMRVDENPPSVGLGFDPTAIATNAANRVLANISPAAQQAGAQPQPGFQLPRTVAPVAGQAPQAAPAEPGGFYLPPAEDVRAMLEARRKLEEQRQQDITAALSPVTTGPPVPLPPS